MRKPNFSGILSSMRKIEETPLFNIFDLADKKYAVPKTNFAIKEEDGWLMLVEPDKAKKESEEGWEYVPDTPAPFSLLGPQGEMIHFFSAYDILEVEDTQDLRMIHELGSLIE